MPKKEKITSLTKLSQKKILPPKSFKKIEKKKDFFLATGNRKTAIAQVKFIPQGKGEIIINQINYRKYFPYFVWQENVLSPLRLTNLEKGDVVVKISGGGMRTQAESVRLGISRALIKYNPELRKILKPAGFLSRDARIKERKKPGLKRARRAPQWQKR